MKFGELSVYFDRLEITSSRLELIDILSELFQKTNKEDIDKVIYLLQGRVAPFFAPVELGMADKTVADALGRVFVRSKDDVLRDYARIGDMGKVVEDYSLKLGNKGSDLDVDKVFQTLISIAQTSGHGTVEKRIELFSDLIKSLDASSNKHLTRIMLGNMRLGIGDPTVLDGLALGVLGDRKLRKKLEKAYNETSDLGLIGKTLLEGGLTEVEKLKISVGRPIRSELCERLPSPDKVFEKMGDKVHSTYKYDGFRVQIHKNGNEVSMYSRNLENMSHMFPELIEGVRRQIKAKSIILDTEALAYNPLSEEFLPFQETTKRRRKHNIDEVAKKLPLRAFVFDILYLNGKSLIDTPLLERVEHLKTAVEGEETLIPSIGEIVDDPKRLQFMLDDAISKGLEGLVVKKVDSLYEAGGRNFNWVKLKRAQSGELNDTIDCVILGYIYGRGKRADFGAGALLTGIYDKQTDEFVTICKIGTGLTDDEWRSIKDKAKGLEVGHKPARVNSNITPSVWLKPEIVIEVLADEITRSPIHTAGVSRSESGEDGKSEGYALRFPRLIKFRDTDKNPEEATSVDELVEMFESQGKK